MQEAEALSILKKQNKIYKELKENLNKSYSEKQLLEVRKEIETLRNKINEIALKTYIPGHIQKFKKVQIEILKLIEDLITEEKFKNVSEEKIEEKKDNLLSDDSFHSIESNNNNHDMATLNTFETLKLVPIFEGEENELNNFCNIVEAIGETLKDDAERKKLFKLVLKTRINERVRIKIGSVTEAENFTSFKKLFKPFQKKLNPLKIQNEMSRTRQGEQSVQNFANKIDNLVTQLNNMQIAENGDTSGTTIRALNKKAGLAEPFKTAVFAAMPDTFEKAVEIAVQMEAVNDAQPKVHYIITRGGYNSYRKNHGYRNNNSVSYHQNQFSHMEHNKPPQFKRYKNNYNHVAYNNMNRNNNSNMTRNQNRDISQNNYARRQTNNHFRRNHENRRYVVQTRNIRVLNSENGNTVPEAHQSVDEENYQIINNH